MQRYGVKIKPSGIPNSGKGLFATRTIEADTWICPHNGETITQQCLDQGYDENETAPYALKDTWRWYVDSACQRG